MVDIVRQDRTSCRLPHLARRVLIYTGRRSFVSSDGIEVWPAGRFAAAVADGRLWP